MYKPKVYNILCTLTTHVLVILPQHHLINYYPLIIVLLSP